jgi:hypothetical protein
MGNMAKFTERPQWFIDFIDLLLCFTELDDGKIETGNPYI